jgi:hypothetical protein
MDLLANFQSTPTAVATPVAATKPVKPASNSKILFEKENPDKDYAAISKEDQAEYKARWKALDDQYKKNMAAWIVDHPEGSLRHALH